MASKVEVVVSGISGRFPSSDNMEELEFNLYNGIDMVTADDSRWPMGLFNLSHRNGKLKSTAVEKFDAEFFDIDEKMANYVDPNHRMFLELAYETVIDAGLDPQELRGSNTSFFWGNCFLETHMDFDDPLRTPALERSNITKVSQFFDWRGPVMQADTACNSSLNAITMALHALQTGMSDRVMVAGSNTCFRPLVSLRFRDLKMINTDGICKCLDDSANGYCRSEAAVVVMLERATDAKRVYAKVLNAKSSADGFKEEGITFPSIERQKQLAQETYAEVGINPADIGYVEAHVTGTAAGDPVEMEAVYEVIASKKTEPLLVGCIKSQIGHSEGASGLCSMAKALLVLQKRSIPPNIYFKKPNTKIRGLMDGKLKPVLKVTPLPGDLVPVNSFGFGGANTLVVLQGVYPKDRQPTYANCPRLVTVCGRTADSVRHIFQRLQDDKKYLSSEFLYLLDNFASVRDPKFKFRGHVLITKDVSGRYTFEKSAIKQVQLEQVAPEVCLRLGLDDNSNDCMSKLRQLTVFESEYSKLTLRLGVKLDPSMMSAAADICAIDLLKKIGLRVASVWGQTFPEVIEYVTGAITAKDAILKAGKSKETVIPVPSSPICRLELSQGLTSIGDLYTQGHMVHASKLDVDVATPLPSWTPTLSSFLKWNHSKTYSLKPYLVQDNFVQKNKNIRYHCDSKGVEDAFIYDHRIDGRILYPATGYLMLAWISFTKFLNCSVWDYAVEFRDIKFHRATVLKKGQETSLNVRYNEATEEFVVIESDTVVVSGYICRRADMAVTHPVADTESDQAILLPAKDIYKELRVRGYDYGQYFQGLHEASSDGRRAQLIWRDIMPKAAKETYTLETQEEKAALWLRSWVPFVDAMFQLDILKEDNDSRSLFVPTRIDSIICSPELMQSNIASSKAFVDALTMSEANLVKTSGRIDNIIWTQGLVVKGLKCTMLKRKAQPVRLQTYASVPLDDPVTLGQRDRMMMDNYEAACLAAHKGRDVPHSFKLDDSRYSLLKSLTSGQNAQPMDLSRDLLVGDQLDDFFYPERFLQPIVNIVVRNLNFQPEMVQSLDILEVTSSPYSLYNKVNDMFEQCLLDDIVKLSYHISPSAVGSMPDNVKPDETVTLHDGSPDDKGVKANSMDFIIYHASSQDGQDKFDELKRLLKDTGFLLVIAKQSNCARAEVGLPTGPSTDSGSIKKAAHSAGLTFIGEKKVYRTVSLFGHLYRRTPIVDLDNTRVVEIGARSYDQWYETLKLYLREENSAKDKRVWLVNKPVSQDGDYVSKLTAIVGFAKSLRFEEGGERVRCLVDLTATQPIDLANPKYAEWGVYDQLTISGDETPTKTSDNYYLKVMKPGDLSSLTWVESDVTNKASLVKGSQLINVHYSALNFRDIMFASGRLDSDAIPGIHPNVASDSILGLEYSGVDSQSGQRVMGITPYKGLASTVLASRDEQEFVWPVPDSWSLEDAATVPVVYATALYALILRGQLTSLDSVLIHSGCGGVGLAAISVAIHRGCKVFTTVGSEAKKAYLVAKWPQLSGHIFNSRQVSFEEDILKATSGHGVDVILNSLAEDKLQAGLRCLASNGRFLEIGKVDFIQNSPLYGHQLGSNQSFHGVLLDALFRYSDKTYLPPRLEAERKKLRQLVLTGLQDGSVRPLDRTLFDKDSTEDAFRFMASGKHVGKVLVHMTKDTLDRRSVAASTYCHPDKVYIVLGGAGGFGLEVVQWLVTRGARKVVIASRRGLREPYQLYAISKLRKQGVQVTIDHSDITKEDTCYTLTTKAMQQGHIGGIFNAAVIYKDALYDSQSLAHFKDVCAPKAEASLHFDKISRQLCPHLDYFVVWSSLSCARGNAGQTNYSYGNSLMDSICERRRLDGLPGLSIMWGVVGDVGTLAETANSNEMVLLGSQAQRMFSCFEVMDKCMQGSSPVCISYVKAEKRDSRSTSSDTVDILNVITRLLGLKDMSNLDQDITLGGLGVDSLIAVEIKQALDKTLDTQVTVREVRDLTVGRLVQLSAEQYAKPKTPATLPTD
ncbi:Fatty acid synthase [Halotydeus destructor]|nr:Fatty acid synthase [Halotydeus destructor]